MKKQIILTILSFIVLSTHLMGQIVINEINIAASPILTVEPSHIELKNIGSTTVDISTYWLYTTTNPVNPYIRLNTMDIFCGELMLEPQGFVTVKKSDLILDPYAGQLGLFSADVFVLPTYAVDFVAWGFYLSSNTSDLFVTNGQWIENAVVEGDTDGISISYDGSGDRAADWYQGEITYCLENKMKEVEEPCEVLGGSFNQLSYTFCVGDGIPDIITDVVLTGNVGAISQYVITSEDGDILALPESLDAVDFDAAGPGNCLVWNVSHDGDLPGLNVEESLFDLTGCFAVSSRILIVRLEAVGGTLAGGPYSFCVGDGEADFVSNLSLSGNVGTYSKWVVTDEASNIITTTDDPKTVNFDEAPAGVCLIWHLSSTIEISIEPGMNANDFTGCMQFSNPVIVNRLGSDHPDCDSGEEEVPNSYVLIGAQEVRLQNVIVHQGGIGATNENGDVDLLDNTDLTSDKVFTNASEIYIQTGAKANNICAIPASPILPEFLENNTDPTDDQDVEVEENEIIVLTDNVYKDIDVDEGATITFSGHENVFIESLETNENVTILFDQCTNLIVSDKVEIGKYNNFNSGEQAVSVFVHHDVRIKKGSMIYGLIYTEQKLNVYSADQENPTLLHGIFIGDKVKIRDYTEVWYQSITPCAKEDITEVSLEGARLAPDAESEIPSINFDALKTLQVFPNPAKKRAYINFAESAETNVELQILNTDSEIVFQKEAFPLSTKALELLLDQFPAGIYFVKASANNGSEFTQKMIVVE